MTKVYFDVVTAKHRHALDRAGVNRTLAQAYEAVPGLRDSLRSVRLGCNRKTTQEGRVTQRGRWFEIRINFCLEENRTRVISTSKSWLRHVRRFGGVPDLASGQVSWTDDAAGKYATFLLLHEIAHIVYMRRIGESAFLEGHGGGDEEVFCDRWAERALTSWMRS